MCNLQFQEDFPLPSFLDSSFDPSDNQLNVLEAKGDTHGINEENTEGNVTEEQKIVLDETKSTEDEGIID